MFGSIGAVIEFLSLCRDVYLFIDDQLTEADFNAKCKARKEKRKAYITEEKQKMRLEILRELERNDPRRND